MKKDQAIRLVPSDVLFTPLLSFLTELERKARCRLRLERQVDELIGYFTF